MTDELDFRREHFAAAADAAGLLARRTSAGHLPRADRLRVCPRHRSRRPPARQADDGQRRARPALVAGPHARRAGHGDRLEPRRQLAADVRRRTALPPGDVQGQAVLLPDEHPLRELLARAGRKVHEALPGLRHVPRLLQSTTPRQGHYFTRPELYNRDRPLFKKYVPLCKRVAEAGWEPITQAQQQTTSTSTSSVSATGISPFSTTAPSGAPPRSAWKAAPRSTAANCSAGATLAWRDGQTTLTLDAEDVAVIEVPQ